MEAKECILQRRSCRRFTDRPVDRDVVREIVELARFAPSWKNKQIVRYTVVDDKAVKDDIARNCVRDFPFNTKTISRCAALAVVSYVTGRSGRDDQGALQSPDAEKWEMFDAGIAAQTFCLAAREYEVGTCIIGVIDEEGIARRLGLPEEEKVACLIAMGYPEEWKSAPPRLTAEELLRFC